MKVTAIVGSYRKGGIIVQAVGEILAAAREAGAETTTISLMDKHIEFCRNCRTCTQSEGAGRGVCAIKDDMDAVLREIEASDAVILASPMNFGTVTAVTKRFIERLICLGYWPWGQMAPRNRIREKKKRAVIVTASAAPAFVYWFISDIVGLLKTAAGLLGAKTVGVLFIGLAAGKQQPELGERRRRRARRLGKKLVA